MHETEIMKFSIAAVICAAGSSSRMGGMKKEYRLLPRPAGANHDKEHLTVLGAALRAFASFTEISPIVITVPDEENAENTAFACLPAEFHSSELRSSELCSREKDRLLFVRGGSTRRISVHNALKRLAAFNPAYVLIHDGARPWIKTDLIVRIIEAVIRHDAVIPGLPLTETPKELCAVNGSCTSPGEPDFIKRHLRRAEVCTAQTPQAFRFSEILSAHEKAAEREAKENFEYTDDAEVWGEFIGQVAVIPGDPENRKITYPEDLMT
jgi:2-C-methyl-D-erythritol 4-phosphate cytidylyltransferase